MVIKASSSKTVDALVADLASSDAITRDAAVARLIVGGARAFQRLRAVASDEAGIAPTRAAAFRALEGIADPRALEPALKALAAVDPAVAIAAIGVARALLRTPEGVTALDHIAAVALDRTRQTAVRVAAIQALSDLDPLTVKPLLTKLAQDPDKEVARAAAPVPPDAKTDAAQYLAAAAEGVLPDDAQTLRRALLDAPQDTPLPLLQQIIERVRVREGSEPPARRTGWMTTRATAHAALAQRGSRLALYDLRETIETARQPVAVEFLAAMTVIGDMTCLESLATAYARASAGAPASPGKAGNPGDNDWWRRHLGDAFRSIAERHAVTRRHAVAKKIEKRWPGVFARLTTGRPPGRDPQ